MKHTLFSLLFLWIPLQEALSSEYILNEFALHVDARDMALGNRICTLETMPDRQLECTFLMPFQLKELSTRKISFCTKLFGLRCQTEYAQTGQTDFLENTLALHLEKQLSGRLYVGIETDLLLISTVGSGLYRSLLVQTDCRYQLSDQWTVGMLVVNPGGARLRSVDKQRPISSSFYVGTRYVPVKQAGITAELGSDLHLKPMLHLGLEYALLEDFTLRTGLSTQPLMPSWGIGGVYKSFRYAWAGTMHPILGISQGFSMTVLW
jgi:hypothetical protein